MTFKTLWIFIKSVLQIHIFFFGLKYNKKLKYKLIITFDDKIREDINREAAKIALSSGKTDKYKCLTGKKILPSKSNNRTS